MYEADPVTYVPCRSRFGVTGFFSVDETLIDCGPSCHHRTFRDFLTENPAKRVLITHSHEDHAGNASLALSRGIIPMAHEKALPILRKGIPSPARYRKWMWGKTPPVEAQALPEVVETPHHHFIVLPTPGHSADHVCFYEPNQRWLFAGDLFLSRKLMWLGQTEEIDGMIASLARVSDLEIRTLYCAHVGPIEDGSYFLRERLTYILDLRDTVRGLASQGYSVHSIQKRLRMKDRRIRWSTLGERSAVNLIRALIASRGTVRDFPSGR